MADRVFPKEVHSQLLQLPDPCLLTVLQCCADDLSSLFSAARAHSRLHQAAAVALSSITVKLGQQQQAEGLLKYMSSHGQHVDSMELEGATLEGASGVCVTSRSRRVSLHQLPDHLQLSSLVLSHLQLQLQPGARFQGMVRPG
jgi:hypothetical protein